jgi:hypothetical protein
MAEVWRALASVPFGGAAMKIVNTSPVAMPKLAPISVNVGAPVASFATSSQRVWAPRWKPMPMQLKAVARGSVAVEP